MQLHRRALSGVTALVLLATSWLGTSLAHAEPIDTSSRQEVAEAYNARLLPTLTAKPKWTGSVKKCTKRPKAQPKKAVGTDSAASKKATIQAVNYFREMAGLSPVKEDVKLSALAQQSALIMKANDTLSHWPAKSWKCYSTQGGDASAHSNLAISWGTSDGPEVGSGARAIALYMDDYGDHNKPVGHRVWMLHPETSKMGTGSTDNTNALYVDSEEDSHNANPRPDGGVAWPSKGYFPWETMPTSKRWSFSLAPRYVEEEVEPGLWRIGYDGELFGKAKVTMTKNGKTVKTKVISRAWAAADPTLVWETTKKLTKPKPGKTDTYKVTISGVKGHADVAYSVKVFMASYKAFSTAPKPTISGTAQVGKKLTANPGAWKPSSAKLSYQWYRGSSKIAGATEKTYTPTKADKGRTVKVKVTAKKSGYTTTSKFSATRKVT
ncbi:MAG TPA: CAP domain-containing protein [Arachnia sp.]|nr:CAP domain-containing protein [Arachnia sp.]